MYLLEMVVAVGLSGVFVCLLSGLLSQTLALSSASQNQLIAINSAEVLLENAKVTPFSVLQQQAGQPPIQLVVNLDQAGSTFPAIRSIPVQLDLTNPINIYGTVNGATGIVNASNQWVLNKGNYFRGAATLQVQDAVVPNDYLQITVTVTYSDSFGASSSVTRSAYVFQNGASFQQ